MASQDYRLEPATEADLGALMGWFETERDVKIWGGPEFRYPCTRETFLHDTRWKEMATFALREPSGEMVGFGQLYDRIGRINLARLIVRSDQRGKGLGKTLIAKLLDAGPRLLPLQEFSLFVYRYNTPALECYKSMGFEINDYPENHALAGEALYLTRPVKC